MITNCPQCGKDNMVQKVSAVYKSGITTHGGTLLAGKLAPPTNEEIKEVLQREYPIPPRPLDPLQEWVISGVLILICFLIWIGLSFLINLFDLFDPGLIVVLTGCLAFVLLIIIARWLYKVKILISIDERYPEYQPALDSVLERRKHRRSQITERWNQLYYCARDDCVFIPDTNQSVPVNKIDDLLYQ